MSFQNKSSYRREIIRLTAARRIEDGLCRRCGNAAEPGRTQCLAHLAESAKQARRNELRELSGWFGRRRQIAALMRKRDWWQRRDQWLTQARRWPSLEYGGIYDHVKPDNILSDLPDPDWRATSVLAGASRAGTSWRAR